LLCTENAILAAGLTSVVLSVWLYAIGIVATGYAYAGAI